MSCGRTLTHGKIKIGSTFSFDASLRKYSSLSWGRRPLLPVVSSKNSAHNVHSDKGCLTPNVCMVIGGGTIVRRQYTTSGGARRRMMSSDRFKEFITSTYPPINTNDDGYSGDHVVTRREASPSPSWFQKFVQWRHDMKQTKRKTEEEAEANEEQDSIRWISRRNDDGSGETTDDRFIALPPLPDNAVLWQHDIVRSTFNDAVTKLTQLENQSEVLPIALILYAPGFLLALLFAIPCYIVGLPLLLMRGIVRSMVRRRPLDHMTTTDSISIFPVYVGNQILALGWHSIRTITPFQRTWTQLSQSMPLQTWDYIALSRLIENNVFRFSPGELVCLRRALKQFRGYGDSGDDCSRMQTHLLRMAQWQCQNGKEQDSLWTPIVLIELADQDLRSGYAISDDVQVELVEALHRMKKDHSGAHPLYNDYIRYVDDVIRTLKA